MPRKATVRPEVTVDGDERASEWALEQSDAIYWSVLRGETVKAFRAHQNVRKSLDQACSSAPPVPKAIAEVRHEP